MDLSLCTLLFSLFCLLLFNLYLLMMGLNARHTPMAAVSEVFLVGCKDVMKTKKTLLDSAIQSAVMGISALVQFAGAI